MKKLHSFKMSVLKASVVGLVLSGVFMSGSALAVTPFTVRDIRVEGLQRTEPGTVFSYLPVKVGDTFSDEKAALSIKTLFATGFFKDVRVEVDNDVLVVIVEERPAIASIDFVGNKEFEKDVLKKALKDFGLSEAKTFDKALLDRAEQELKRQYLSRGRYAAQVSTTVTPLERNRVAVVFSIAEGAVASIKSIKINGLKAFKEKEILDQFSLSTGGLFSFFSKDDQYSRQKLAGDLETLRSYYLNRGYLEFNIESTQVQISPDKQDIFITLNITEGEKFTVGKIKLAGEVFNREKELLSLVKLKTGDTFSGELLNESTKAITDRLGNYGYAFANANAAPELDRTKKTVDFTVFIDPGKRAYVRRINIGGNTRTRDEVVRRELRQFESSFYDAEKIKLSKDRIERLGYFKDVNIDTPAVAGTSDQLDVNINVTEKPTGNLLLGAGISSTEKLVLSTSINQQNLFGSGKTVGLELNTSRLQRTISVSQTDPYFTPDGVARGYDVYYRTYNPSILNLGNYKITSAGAGLRFAYPVSEFERISFGTSLEQTELTVDSTSPARYITYVNQFGAKSYGVIGNFGYTFDNRDSALTPTRGRLRRLGIEIAAPLGDQRFIKSSYNEQAYIPIGRRFTLALNGDIVIGGGYSGKPYPIFRNVYAGGIGTIRGFQTSSLGPRDSDGLPTGGSKRVIGNAEFYFPVPGLNVDKSFRLFAFIDGGNVFQASEQIRISDFRYSSGVGLSWISPVGPLKFSLGAPLNKKDGDRTQVLQFTLGSAF